MAVAVSTASLATAAAAAADTTETPASPRLVLLAVSINGIDQGEPLWVLRDAGDILYLPLSAITAWRLMPGAARSITFQGEAYVAIAAIPGVTARIDEITQSLALTVEAASFDKARIDITGDYSAAMTQSGLGGFLNYDLLAQMANGRARLNGAFELGTFIGAGSGVTTFVGTIGEGVRKLTRLETNWTIDDPQRMRSLRFGDSVSRGGIGTAPLRFAGVQFASNFATQPGFVTMSLPTLNGSAAVPSVVDIYVNNILQGRQQVAPGPFQLTGVPVVTGSGDIQLVVRDALGRETMVSQSYYAAPQMLRQGLHDYSYEVGFLRRDFGISSNRYGAAVASGTHRYGLTDTVTVEAHAEATRHTQAGSVAVNLLLPDVGIFSVSAAASESSGGEGTLFGLGFERRTRGLSIGAAGEIATADYMTVGASPDRPRARSTARVFAGLPTGFGSIGSSFLWRQGRGQPDAAFLGANASVRIASLGTLHMSGRKSLSGVRDTAAELFLTIPLGGRTSASAGLQLRDGKAGMTADIQRNLPEGSGFGFRASAALGLVDRLSGAVSAQTAIGNADVGLDLIAGQIGVRAGISGSIATYDRQVFASRRLSQSFAVVSVGYPDVAVYADNHLVGRTNKAGVAIVPRLRAFQDNQIRIEIGDLPLDTTVVATERSVRPYSRSGVAVRFAVKASRGGLVTVMLESGEALPAGTAVHLNGQPEEFVSAPGGDVYLTGLEANNIAVATFGVRQCAFGFSFTAGTDPQPRLGKVICALKPS